MRRDAGLQRAAAAGRGSLIRSACGLTLVAIFATSVIVHVAPASPLTLLVRPVTDHLVRPFFVQRWNLFAPAPPSADLSTYLVVRYDDARTSRPFDLSAAVRRTQVSQRLAAPRLVRVVSKLGQAFEQKAYADARRGVARRDAALLARCRRVLVAASINVARSDAHIVSVRGVVLRTAVRSFQTRHRSQTAIAFRLVDPDKAPAPISPDVIADVRGRGRTAALIFDSGWMPYLGSVTPLWLR